MSSSSRKKPSHLSRKSLAADIAKTGTEMAPCKNCRNAKVAPGKPKPRCVVGPRSQKCSECVRKNCKECDVTLSAPQWEKLRDLREKLRRDIESLEEEEVEIMQKLQDRRMKKIRLRKQLRLAERRTDDAIGEALDILESEEPPAEEELSAEVGVEISEYPFEFHSILEMPPDDWAALAGFSNFAALGSPSGPPETVLGVAGS